MDTQAVAARLIELCSRNLFLQAQEELYHNNIISIDPDGSRTEGRVQMHAKERRFLGQLAAIHSTRFSPPRFAGTYFSTVLAMEIEFKAAGRFALEEICVYQVAGGKIVFEQFFRDGNQ